MLPVPVAVPVSQPGSAWQLPPPPQMAPQAQLPPPPPHLPRRVVFANPHPAAAPVPATALQSRYMTARDISFVVHAMLKPILAAEQAGTMSTYHVQYWMRHHPVKPPPLPVAKRSLMQQDEEEGKDDFAAMEMVSRYKKSKEWSSQHKVLGQTAKTNVARPRALIAVSNTSASEGTDKGSKQQQRAALWKSRIYCDQAYHCLTTVIDSWQSSPGALSASVQPHLLKLTKCLGVSVETVVESDETQARNQYKVDPAVLQLLLKLPKGKVLLARVLEQALLPPAIVQALLPVALSVLLTAATTATLSETTSDGAGLVADDRVFAAWTVVIQTLPDLSGTAILQSVGAVQQQAEAALSTTARMQCTHALLQRGSACAAAANTTADTTFANEWATTEAEFMNILAGL